MSCALIKIDIGRVRKRETRAEQEQATSETRLNSCDLPTTYLVPECRLSLYG